MLEKGTFYAGTECSSFRDNLRIYVRHTQNIRQATPTIPGIGNVVS